MTPEYRKTTLLKILNDSLERMHPGNVVRDNLLFDKEKGQLTVAGETVQLAKHQKAWITGAGKAAVAMAEAAAEILGNRIADGLVIAPDKPEKKIPHVQVLKGTHPVPDKESLSSTYELVHFARSIPAEEPVLFLLSGGASALLCLPEDGLEIEEVGELHKLLLESGMDIHQMNTIRKIVSKVKAGGLLRYLSHTQLFDLVISDVPGDQLSSIGSGPATFEQKQFEEAFKLLKQSGIWNTIPHAIRIHIARGIYENLQEEEPTPFRHHSKIISSAGMLAETVANEVRRAGFKARIVHPAYNQPIGNIENMILENIRVSEGEIAQSPEENSQNGETNQQAHQCLIFYGESSVNVTGDGKGGRNQELALRIARHLDAGRPVTLASLGTDGVDGPTNAAGAIVDETTMEQAVQMNLDPDSYLKNNDSYTFFEKTGGLIKTGPTGNNLMDLQVVMVVNSG